MEKTIEDPKDLSPALLELFYQVQKVAKIREEQAAAQQEIQELERRFHEWPEVKAASEKYDSCIKAQAEARKLLDALALSIFQATEGKKPLGAVGIRENKKVVLVQDADVDAWALSNMPTIMKVDNRKFEQAVLAGFVPDEIAKVEIVPQVTLASDLTDYLKFG